VNDDVRLTVALPTEADAHALLRELHELVLEGKGAFEERVIVSNDGSNVFLYSDNEQRLEHARELVDEAMREASLGGMIRIHRWHPVEERWEDADMPLPRTPEEIEAERQVRLARETEESETTGHAEWEVRVELPSHRETVRLAEQLESEGLAVVRRWKFLLVGAANEDAARTLAERIGAEAPDDATIAVEPGGEMVWEVAPQNPFVVFGGLGV
jgi:hypothetical protein